jgi:DNA sulfur modification protein DndE
VIIETIRLSQGARGQLINLKRKTGIENWNVLCRWGFVLSLKERGSPPTQKIAADSNLEMSWKVFGGRYCDIYEALFLSRCIVEGVDVEDSKAVSEHFRLHLHRGISYLAGDKRVKDIVTLASRALE